MNPMISFSDALQTITCLPVEQSAERVSLGDALGRVLSQAVCAPVSLPLFASSAMDGYLYLSTLPGQRRVIGSIYAGNPWTGAVPAQDEAVYIATGAPVPEWGYGVVPIERCVEHKDTVVCKGAIEPQSHIRPAGQDCAKNEMIIEAGAVLTLNHTALLRALGIEGVFVLRRPRGTILATGNEVAQVGEALKPGQVYDVNRGWLQEFMRPLFSVGPAQLLPDDPDQLENAVTAALPENEVLVFSGGMSVGRKDYTLSVLERRLGCKRAFYKVAQKPGKPMYYGIMPNGTKVVGLPGNPAAAMMCAWVYLRAMGSVMQGLNAPGSQTMSLYSPYPNKSDRTHLLWGTIRDRQFVAQNKQNSHLLSGAAHASALAVIPPQTDVDTGDVVEVYSLST